MKKCKVGIHKDCVELTAGNMRLAITTKVGPRIIGCYIGKGSKTNQFVELPAKPMEQPGNGYILYGGHRLWHAPEDCPLCYEPDNAPVDVTETPSGVIFSIPADPITGIAKRIMVEPLENGLFCITHTIENCSPWTIEVAPWALTMMAPGGTTIIPQGFNPDGFPYTPDRQLTFWPYTDLKDPRLVMGQNFIYLKQDPKAKTNMKIGYNDECGWVAYVNKGTAFIKYFDYDDEGDYPDSGCTVESYTCSKFTEVETLAPLETLEPGECAQHVEYWQGLTDLPAIETDEDVENYLLPYLLTSECDCDCCEDDEYDDDCDCGCGCDCGCEDDDCDCDCGDDCHCGDDDHDCDCGDDCKCKEKKAAKSGKGSRKKK